MFEMILNKALCVIQKWNIDNFSEAVFHIGAVFNP